MSRATGKQRTVLIQVLEDERSMTMIDNLLEEVGLTSIPLALYGACEVEVIAYVDAYSIIKGFAAGNRK